MPLSMKSAKLLLIALAALLLSQAGCATLSSETGTVGTLPEVIDESSGLIAGMNRSDLLWTHNDSGDRARIFAIDLSGNLVGEIEIENAEAFDWEAITSDRKGRLLIGDIGNNGNQRENLTIYVVPEPDPKAGRARVERAIRFRYPEQTSLPDQADFNYDAEALFWWKDRLFLLTKHRSDQNTVLYAFPESAADEPLDLIKVSQAALGPESRDEPFNHPLMVTDAALSPDQRHLAVLTYAGIVIFAAPDDGYDFLAHPIKRIDFDTDVTIQCEGLAWIGDALYMTNEQRGLHRLHNPLAREFTTYP